MLLSIDEELLEQLPDFHVGIIVYKNIVIDNSPAMLRGRLDFFQEKIKTDLLQQSVSDYPGVKEWQETFRKISIDPKRYRPSHEALFRRISKGQAIPFIHSAVDLNNFFSLQYEIPIGIYNLDTINDYIKLCIGTEADRYEGLNGRENNLKGKVISRDSQGAFGSPIVDSNRTATDSKTTNIAQIFYLRPSMDKHETKQLLDAAAKMFFQIHSGDATIHCLSKNCPQVNFS